MSRAFVTDKEDWIYCAKAGERCMHAESGKPCRRTDCEYFGRAAKAPVNSPGGLRVVSRRAEKAAAGEMAEAAGKIKAAEKTKAAEKKAGEPRPRKTKKASLPKPRKWGGRSGSI